METLHQLSTHWRQLLMIALIGIGFVLTIFYLAWGEVPGKRSVLMRKIVRIAIYVIAWVVLMLMASVLIDI